MQYAALVMMSLLYTVSGANSKKDITIHTMTHSIPAI